MTNLNITAIKNFWKIIPWKVIALISLFGGLYYQIILSMGNDWYTDSDYSHGFLIPFISVYIIWTNREKITTIRTKPDNLGLLVLCTGLSLYILGVTGAEFFTMRFSMIPIILGIVYYLCGREMVKSILVPVGFLVFMIPIPEIVYNVIAFPLKLLAANIATNIIQIINIPVVRDGNVIHLKDLTLEVADACSGIRSLMSMIALGVAYSYIFQKGVLKRVILVLTIVPITIITNVARVTGTGILSHYVGPAAASGFFHEFAGIAVFLVAFALFLLVATILKIWKTEP